MTPGTRTCNNLLFFKFSYSFVFYVFACVCVSVCVCVCVFVCVYEHHSLVQVETESGKVGKRQDNLESGDDRHDARA
jgi:hypothetical protein